MGFSLPGPKWDPENPRSVVDDDFLGFLAKPLGPLKTAQDGVYMVLMVGAVICLVLSLLELNVIGTVVSAVLALLSAHTLLVHIDRVRLYKKLAISQDLLKTSEDKLRSSEYKVQQLQKTSPAVLPASPQSKVSVTLSQASPQSVSEWCPLPPPDEQASTRCGDSPASADLKDGNITSPIKGISLNDIMPEGVHVVHKQDMSAKAGPASALKEGMGPVEAQMNGYHTEPRKHSKPFSNYAREHTHSLDGTEMHEQVCHQHAGLCEAGLRLLMEHPGDGQMKTFFLTQRPIGLQFWQSLPLCLTTVEGHAQELGVEEGWIVKEFAEHEVSKFNTFKEAYEQFSKAAGQLPQK